MGGTGAAAESQSKQPAQRRFPALPPSPACVQGGERERTSPRVQHCHCHCRACYHCHWWLPCWLAEAPSSGDPMNDGMAAGCGGRLRRQPAGLCLPGPGLAPLLLLLLFILMPCCGECQQADG